MPTRPFVKQGDVLGLLLIGALTMSACDPTAPHSIVPIPRSIETGEGAFVLDGSSAITLTDPSDTEARDIVELWAGAARAGTGLALPFAADGALRVGVDGSGGPESYRLTVSESGISIAAGDHAGLFYGLQTLSQLLPPGLGDGAGPGDGAGQGGGAGLAAAPLEIRSVRIDDAPRFPYRGMHLDVARHFFGPEFVKHYIDMLARYKINRFHWHLTEDQGWRIQIDRYPLLTEVGAYRAQTHIGHSRDDFNGDGQRYGGFYTKDEIRDIVAYAEARYVTIVPEIEMPGHSLAALAAYPELACTPGPFEVGMTWGVFEDIYCPSEETFTFLENVLTEVIELFPGELIHVGGDEAPKERWEESEFVQQLKEREGLADEHEVQSWFIQRIERFLNANGRRLIGWDEILEGGLAPNATVMSWRGAEGGIEAAGQGHDVVMTPYSHLYFDFYQAEDQEGEPFAIGGFLPLDTVYSYEPVPVELTPTEARHILGAQANVWTEYMTTEDHVEYMLLPRMLALSEVVWSPSERRDFDGFVSRLDWHFDRFDALGVNYRPLDP